MKKTIYFVLFVTTLLILQGCKKDNSNPVSPGGGPGQNEVFIQNMSFNPSSKTVSVGTTVKWTNKDGVTHTVTSGDPGSPNGTFDSGSIGSGADFSFTFSTAGTYKYYCKIHPNMIGTIVVQ